MDNNIICDVCNKEFKITEKSLKTVPLYDKNYNKIIKIAYFECIECGQVYVYKITDEFVKLQEERIKQYTLKLKDTTKSIEKRTKYYNNLKKALKDNIDYQRRLKNKYKDVRINEKTIK